jgi:hypothetical protein
VEIDDAVEACQRAFSTVCAFIGTWDLIQEHISFRVCPLVESWDMPKETIADSSDGGLVRLKYTFRFREKFDEPTDDWLKCIEAINDELLRAYSKAEDNALSATFGGRGKKRLNRVFDAIGFIYPDYRYPLRGQGKKRKTAASATTAVPKGKKVKVLTHRPCYIEPVVVPEFVEGASSTAEATQASPIAQSVEEPTVMSKMPTIEADKANYVNTEEARVEEIMKMLEILNPPTEAKLPKVQKVSAATPKRRRMANVLETTKALSPAPTKKIIEAAKAQAEIEVGQAEAEVGQAEAEAGPSIPSETKASMPEDEVDQQTSDAVMAGWKDIAEKAKSLSHPVLEGKPNVNHVRARISNSRTQQLHNWTSSHSAKIMT